MLDSCACDATGETAAEFFGYVDNLSLEDTDPQNAEVWEGENVSSGEEYAAEDARLKLYGIEGKRTLELVAPGLPPDIVSEQPGQTVSEQERDRNRGEGASLLRAWQDAAGMTTTKAEKTEETRIGERGRTEPPWNVLLHNDRNPINRVVWRLWRTIPGMTMKRATRVTWEAHTKGRAVAKTCHKELADLYEERLRAKELTVSTEPTS